MFYISEKMPEKYRNKYRMASARAGWWDYGWDGAYFITICTEHRHHYFGKIRQGKMLLSNAGVLADVFWAEIPNHNTSVKLGAFVVMPNHVHGILILNGGTGIPGVLGLPTGAAGPVVETLHATSPHTPTKNEKMSAISPNAKTVSAIVRSYKSAVTKHANRLELPFGWQTRFYDHIIREDQAYQRINDYIENNPANWNEDGFFEHG